MKKLMITLSLTVLAMCCTVMAAAESHAHTGGRATCSALAVCAECGQTYGRLADHSWSAWRSDDASTHTRACQTDPTHKETRYHMGGASTCTQGAVCLLCSAEHDAPLGHDPVPLSGYAAACDRSGLTDGEACSRCRAVVTARQTIPASGHSYNTWSPLSDGTHFSECASDGCGSAAAVLCTPFEVMADGAALTICPICGAIGNAVLPVRFSGQDAALAIGQLLVRGMAEPFGGALYAFTVTGSYAGEFRELSGQATVTIEDDFDSLPGFRVVRVDAASADTSSLHAEAWTDMPFTLDGGRLIITTDRCGLFLLVPAE